MTTKPLLISDFSVHADGYIICPKEIKSLAEYLDIIVILKNSWVTKWLFYRGTCNHTYDLLPSIYRHGNQPYKSEIVSEIFSEFKRKSRFLLEQTKTDWEYYEIMQHYGFPTRLLDWSTGSLIALFFALINLSNCDKPCVWILDPVWLNKRTVNKNKVFSTLDKEPFLDNFLYDDKLNYQNPISLLPSTHNSRILAQKGCFTIHGISQSPMNNMFSNMTDVKICKVVFENDFLKNIKRELTSTGVNHSNIFPDLEGLANELKYEYDIH